MSRSTMITTIWVCVLILPYVCEAYEEVCYEIVGCIKHTPPYVTSTRPTPPPLSPKLINLRLFLVTRNNDEIELNERPNSTTVDLLKPTYFLIHGVSSSRKFNLIQNLKDAILKDRDVNVVLVDWSPGANSGDYLQMASTATVVGKLLGRAIVLMTDSANDLQVTVTKSQETTNWTVEDYAKNVISMGTKNINETNQWKRSNQLQANNIILIGHSMGAHIAGYTGRYVAKNLNAKVRSIFALDPSQQFFEFNHPKLSLKKSDAEVVVVSHTSGRFFVPYWGRGYIAPLGHIDFFFAGGGYQPGCRDPQPEEYLLLATAEEISSVTHDQLEKFSLCPHRRALEYLIESINNRDRKFWGKKISNADMEKALSNIYLPRLNLKPENENELCSAETCPIFDIDSYRSHFRGNYYVDVNSQSPFSPDS